MTKEAALKKLEESWRAPRYEGVIRPYRAEDVIRLRGSVLVEQTLAQRGAERLWTMLKQQKYIHALGALTGNQAVQQVKAGLKAIYLSGWQVAADANLSGQMYPDQSLYPPRPASRTDHFNPQPLQQFQNLSLFFHSDHTSFIYFFFHLLSGTILPLPYSKSCHNVSELIKIIKYITRSSKW